jgi:glycerophosphoryl diester phosphodiesterase
MKNKTEIHGHRGFRGKFPENTLIAFKEAAKLGVDAIELDVVISKDSQVVVSHEPWFNYKTCSSPDGERVRARKQHNLHKMNYAEIKKYDCGRRGNPEFPEQAHIEAYKPLLSEVIQELESFCKENNLPPIQYNIEIKCWKLGDGKWHPKPAVVSKLVIDVLNKFKINNRIMIQSFDTRCLQVVHQLVPDIRIGLLVANTGSVDHNVKKLGFTPYMYNPGVARTKQKTIKEAHSIGCKVIVWTVNDEKEMAKLVNWGVDGLITDFPDKAIKKYR